MSYTMLNINALDSFIEKRIENAYIKAHQNSFWKNYFFLVDKKEYLASGVRKCLILK
jgi:hypothetical protein